VSDYQNLQTRLDRGDVIVLDGAIGTEIQAMGAPMNDDSWSALALQSHPSTVLQMHMNYIRAGVDVITTDSYPAARHNLEPLGMGELTMELNIRSVHLAMEARDRARADRPIYIGGAVSDFGLITGGEFQSYRPTIFRRRAAITEEQSRENLHEQARVLAEAGVDFMLAECTGSLIHGRWVSEACASVGLPMWVGFKCHSEEGDPTQKIGYRGQEPLAQALEEVIPMGGSVVTVFHSSVEDTVAAIPIVKEAWSGPVAAYPEASRRDYVDRFRDETLENEMSPESYLDQAREWVEQGVQIIGGCCGMGVDYIRPLREGLPDRVPSV